MGIHQILQKSEMILLAEKIGFVGGKQVDGGLQFLAMAGIVKQAQVLGEVAQLVFTKAPRQPFSKVLKREYSTSVISLVLIPDTCTMNLRQ
jgi:hypothetical protein